MVAGGGRDVRNGFGRDAPPAADENEGRILFVAEAAALAWLATLARLGERDGSSSCLAADAWVGAVAEAGSRTGRVGDLGRALAGGA